MSWWIWGAPSFGRSFLCGIQIHPRSFSFPSLCFCFYWSNCIKSILNCSYIFHKIIIHSNCVQYQLCIRSSYRPAGSLKICRSSARTGWNVEAFRLITSTDQWPDPCWVPETCCENIRQTYKLFCIWISGVVCMNVEEQTFVCDLNAKEGKSWEGSGVRFVWFLL